MRARVVIADDESLVRSALKIFISSSSSFEVVGEAEDGLQAVALVRDLKPDLVVMDIRMPRLHGIEATRRILAAHPATKIVAVTTFATVESVVPMLRAGAAGYLLKDTPPEAVVGALQAVLDGTDVLEPRIAAALVDAVPTQGKQVDCSNIDLTERDQEALALLAQGLSTAEIAKELHIAEVTVKGRMRQLANKLGVTTRLQILVRATQLGLVTPHLRGPVVGDPSV
ncbi:response regulator [Devriesea agamarum]|uniref:response regulator n=1 Tax=Devriesea agamarum TaxID=472569 RepID=UPI00071C83D3|nr:response regulator transcription factor [Devriesea agamarum]